MDVRRDAPRLHGRIAYVGSGASLWPALTGAEALRFLANLHGSVDEPYRTELIERFQLEADKKVRAYSDGNRQKVLLVAALATRADLLLLDEPTRGLDPLMERVFQECVREAHDRGQTVFLSSHILSEVDAVCDRVAMLRNGRVIETGDLEALRGLAAVKVEADLLGDAPDVSHLDGVDQVEVDGRTLRCHVTGPMGPLLTALAQVGVERLMTREPSLEELFMAHYEDTPVDSSVS
jgi:ABC-2 type transport system ATP-binding protein